MGALQDDLDHAYHRMLESSPHLLAVKDVQGDIQVRKLQEGIWSDWSTLILPVADYLADMLLSPMIVSVTVRYNDANVCQAMAWRLAP